MAWTRFGVLLVCVSLAACFGGGEAPRPAPVGAAAADGADADLAAAPEREPSPQPIASAVLTDELLGDGGDDVRATPAAPPVRVLAEAEPLPPEIAIVLGGGAGRDRLDPLDDLAISFGSSGRETFQAALDATSVLDETSLGGAPPVPAAPAPDLR